MNLVRAADGLGPRLGETDRAHLARFHQALHRADGFLDRHFRIDAMLVIDVDHVDAEALQARLAGAQHVGRAAIDVLLAVGALRLAELGGHHHAIAAPTQRLAEQLLVVPPAVHVGRVEKVDALVERVVDHADRLLVVGIAVDARHRHQAEADGRNLDAALAEGAHFHGNSLAAKNQGQTTIITRATRLFRFDAGRFQYLGELLQVGLHPLGDLLRRAVLGEDA